LVPSFAAKELTERGLSVLLLEAGPSISEKDFSPPTAIKPKGINLKMRLSAALHGQHIQARIGFFSDQYKRFFVNDIRNPYTTPLGAPYLWIRGRQLGGRLHLYGRVLLRMTDLDFKAASRDGHGVDWPISYEDLAPFYDKVEEFLGVYGNADNIPNLPDGKYVKEPKLTSAERTFKAAITSKWPDRRVISWRYAAPNLKRVPLPILAALRTGRLTVRTNAVARRIVTDQITGKATAIEFVDGTTRRRESAAASVFVLCASTIESVRLMLNSASPKHPAGLGNSSRLLGRYFMDQCPSQIYGTVPGVTNWELDESAVRDPFYAPAGGVYIPRFQNLDPATTSQYKRGFAFQGAIGRGVVPQGHPAIFGLMGFGEMLPYFDNCIALNARRQDFWGIPVAHITCRLKENERELLRAQARSILEMVDSCGFKVIFSGSTLGLDNKKDAFRDADTLSRLFFRASFKKSLTVGAAIHECGGARMGNTPEESVLNRFNQCWDAQNVFVTDGSCFPSSGTVGPALTIMAITCRACEFIARSYNA